MLTAAAAEANRLRNNWLGPEHLLLAVLGGDSTASEVLGRLGLTHDAVAARLAAITTVNGRRIRYVRSKGVTLNPAAHQIHGWAQGFAAANGKAKPSPEDWLLSIVYSDSGVVSSLLSAMHVGSGAIVAALAEHGVRTPSYEPPAPRSWRGHQEVEVDKSEWQPLVEFLTEKHPPGSEWQWGFTSHPRRRARVKFVAEEGVNLLEAVDEVRTRLAKPG